MITLVTLPSLTKFSWTAGRQKTLSEIRSNTGYDFTVTFVKTAGYYGTPLKCIKHCGKLYNPVKVSKVNWSLAPFYVSLFPTKWNLIDLTHPELPFEAYGNLECETNVRAAKRIFLFRTRLVLVDFQCISHMPIAVLTPTTLSYFCFGLRARLANVK